MQSEIGIPKIQFTVTREQQTMDKTVKKQSFIQYSLAHLTRFTRVQIADIWRVAQAIKL